MRFKRTGRRQILIASAIAMITASAAHAATAERRDDGAFADGKRAEVIVLTAANGVTARIIPMGATLQSYILPDRKGQLADVILGHDRSGEYEAKQDFLGVTVGRYANRIARGSFVLDGKTYRLPLNDGENSLHGGGKGFDRKLWNIASTSNGAVASVTLTLESPDGEMGYPGALAVSTTYALDDRGVLTITMSATTSKPTIINMTNHALFNMAGHCAPQGAMGNRMAIPAARFTPVDSNLIPTGELTPVAGTSFDFRAAKLLSDGLRTAKDPQVLIGRGFDHNWVMDKGQTTEPGLVATVSDPQSGRGMEVFSTEPGLQMYTGNFINGTNAGKEGCLYRMGDGVALEPQKFPDTPNQPAFGSARLDPGQTYRHVMVLRPAPVK